MATKLKEVDALLVGLGWTGGILAKELSRGGPQGGRARARRDAHHEKDFPVPQIRDELRYASRNDSSERPAKDTLTIRNNPSQLALPMRRLGSFLPGDGVGGAGVHWNGRRGAGATTSSRSAAAMRSATARITSQRT